MSADARCRACAHVVIWRTGGGAEHADCLRGMPMSPHCGWHRPKTESLVTLHRRA